MRRVAMPAGGVAAVLDMPAMWGVLGAFIYAGPRWVACIIACRQEAAPALRCHLEFAMALACGAIAAAAFVGPVLGIAKIKDGNAIAAMIGLLVNPTTPILVRRVSNLVGAAISAKVEDKLPGDPS